MLFSFGEQEDFFRISTQKNLSKIIVIVYTIEMAECGLTIMQEKNPDGTVTICAGCPYIAAGLCPSGSELPAYSEPGDPNSARFQKELASIRRTAKRMATVGCPGPIE